MRLSLVPFVVAGGLFALSANALADQYVVKEAALEPAGQCNIGAWHERVDGDNHLTMASFKCNPTGQFNIGAEIGNLEAGGTDDTIGAVNFKTVMQPAALGQVGYGVAVDAGFSDSFSDFDGLDFTVPVSVMLHQRIVVNANAGWNWARNADNALTAGIGTEIGLFEHLHAIGEFYGDEHDRNAMQAGLRYQLGRNGYVDASYGRETGSGNDDWFAIGAGTRF